MAIRKVTAGMPESVRLDIKINLRNYPDIAALYMANPRRFSVTAVEALSLYALLVEKTGANGLASVAHGLSERWLGSNPDLPLAVKPVVKSPPVIPSNVPILSDSAANALLKMDREM